jgi:hypothetical protein
MPAFIKIKMRTTVKWDTTYWGDYKKEFLRSMKKMLNRGFWKKKNPVLTVNDYEVVLEWDYDYA